MVFGDWWAGLQVILYGATGADFQMNRSAPPDRPLCRRAGSAQGIPLAEFGPWPPGPSAVGAGRAVYGIYRDSHPVCASRGASQAEVAAGLVSVHCPQPPPQGRWGQARREPRGASGRRRLGNPGLWLFQQELGEGSRFRPVSISGAYGAAPCWRWSRSAAHPASTDLMRRPGRNTLPGPGVAENIAFYQRAGRCC